MPELHMFWHFKWHAMLKWLPDCGGIGKVLRLHKNILGDCMGELVPQNNTELVAKNGTLYGNYDGVVFYQGSDASIGIGTGIDAKTLASAERGEISKEDVRFSRRSFNGLAAGNLLYQGGLAATGSLMGEWSVPNLIMAGVLTVVPHGMSYLAPRRAKKRHQAIEAMSK